jgi:cell division protein FtsN
MVWRGDHHVDVDRDERDVEDDEFLANQETEEERPRRILSAGWFRAALLLAAVAAVVAVALPSLLDWFEPATTPVREPSRPVRTVAPVEPAAPEDSNPKVVPAKAGAREPAAPRSSITTRPPITTPVSLPLRMTKTSVSDQGVDKRASSAAKPSSGDPGARDAQWVQVGLFKDEQNAQRLAKALGAQGFSTRVTRVTREGSEGGIAGGTYYLVRVGAFRDVRGAVAARDELKARGYTGFVAQAEAK